MEDMFPCYQSSKVHFFGQTGGSSFVICWQSQKVLRTAVEMVRLYFKISMFSGFAGASST